ncbi:uncharacterized protein F4822DRAFT_72712 [Hypoxylon trugodes]|uniref:uncharacterized protein n=1 Tax=Hypoxylon trugodes TaxID=326681 RepID=UPI002195B566|nr:uncharacterized protein F4822DRAFT_72712 [Hypoxylon trugodes]KAI1383296.1 hypothetical protein F4822DRAFT_72712 [Hypoxylon trugodes]
MAPSISNTSAEPTLYDILALTPKHLEGQAGVAQQQIIVKQAYHRALLKYHPDKLTSAKDGSSSPQSKPSASKSTAKQKSGSQPRIQYTVDQIQHAYTVLSDRKQRSEYDRVLRTSPSQRQTQSSSSTFRTGVETVDLDDVSFDERTGVYYRSCRCGNARGYSFTEGNLEEFEEDGVLMVECLDCSLWVRVLFAAAEEEDDGAATAAQPVSSNRGAPDETVMATRRDEEGAVTAEGERRGRGTGRGFTFNWSFNWGISLSGSATAGTKR